MPSARETLTHGCWASARHGSELYRFEPVKVSKQHQGAIVGVEVALKQIANNDNVALQLALVRTATASEYLKSSTQAPLSAERL